MPRTDLTSVAMGLLCLLGGCKGSVQDAPPASPSGETTDTAPVETVPLPGAQLSEGGVQACANPTARASVPYDRRVSPSPPNSEIWVWAGGMIAGDLDGDGYVDLFSPSESVSTVYMGTASGTFAEYQLPAFDLSLGTGGTMADFDGDGDLDVYVTRYAMPNVLLANEGEGQFVDVTESVGGIACNVMDPDTGQVTGGRSTASSWADYDGDGDLDLFVGNYGWVDHSASSASLFGPSEPSCLYRNEGGLTFTDVTAEQLPYSEFHSLHDGYIFVAGFHDLDDDGWPELYAVNDFGTAYPNVLLKNQEGTLVLDDDAHGLDKEMTGMGLGIGDINGDLYPDLVVPIWNDVWLLESMMVGDQPLWVRITGGNGIRVDSSRNQKVGWGAELADMDNDGDLDALVAYGHVDDQGNPTWDNPLHQPDALYVQQSDGMFVDEGAQWGIADDGVGRGFVVLDLNGDGWLDVAKRDLIGPNVVYVSRCGDESWLKVSLRAPGLNTRAIGAKVTVRTGESTQVRWVVSGGTSHETGGPPEVHFGLADAEIVDELTVTWPDRRVSTFHNIETKQALTITQDP